GKYQAGQIIITRRNLRAIAELTEEGYQVTDDNAKAVRYADIVVVAVLPQQLNTLLDAIQEDVDPGKHLLISVASGVNVNDITNRLGKPVQVVRAMPNTAIAIQESMTCIASNNASVENIAKVKDLFDTVGETIEIHEELMTSATALCACGIAFFLRAIRAASQGGIEIGFHAAEALHMAAQTAKGAASLLLQNKSHPENEIDKVTSPKGCTIAGLNEMEHAGFSSALIKGIRLSSIKAGNLYEKD
ncbi:MAG: pyrroline-5-carboxylate reductase, partial [Adhaeribacter sp.]|nr:pyrroline-5-carboxylate reductase [Adhaeribacter sp.]